MTRHWRFHFKCRFKSANIQVPSGTTEVCGTKWLAWQKPCASRSAVPMGLEAVRKHPGVSTPGYFRIVPFGTAGRVQVMAVCKDRRPKIMGCGAPQPYRETSAGGLGRPKTSRPGLEIGVLRTDAFSVSYAAGRVCSPAVHTIRVSELTLSATELTLSVVELTLSATELTLSIIKLTVKDGKSEENGEFLLFARRL